MTGFVKSTVVAARKVPDSKPVLFLKTNVFKMSDDVVDLFIQGCFNEY